MTVTVALYGGLARYLPPGAQNRRAALELPEGSSVLDVMRRLGMSDDLPSIPVVDGKRASTETVLQSGESLSLFPPLAGGGCARPVCPVGRRTGTELAFPCAA
jgi:molybdopterin synthase sulfur carrier subunit